MPIAPLNQISLLTFPQFWDGTSLVVRFLCLPAIAPQAPLRAGLPSFADSNFVFEAKMIGSLNRLPMPSDATSSGPLIPDEPPTQKADLFAELAKEFNIAGRIVNPLAQPPTFQKAMTASYRALIGNRRHSDLLRDPGEFGCALHTGAQDQPSVPTPPADTITWGQLMAHALRQPKLAGALGLMGQVTVTPQDPAFFQSGGWLYIDLHPTSDFGNDPDIAARYGARIPRLPGARTIFAPLLFPVSDTPTDFKADDIAQEAELYDDGIAKLIHCAQGAGHGDSIQLAWDDEQVAQWLHRQVQVDVQGNMVKDAPSGVCGYRVDVRLQGDQVWNSLMRIESLGDLQLGPFTLGSFQGEGVVEVAPAQVSPKKDGEFWLPSYFANWRGSSLVLTDADLTALHARPEVQNPALPSQLLDREKVFAPVGDKLVPLRYGKTYEFRARLSDLTRGGPGPEVASPDPARSSVASLLFQRAKAPGPIEILERPTAASRAVRIARPRLGHPEALFTGLSTFDDLMHDLGVVAALLAVNPGAARQISVADPDVLTVEIEVQVKALDGDVARYLSLYTTTRTFLQDELTIALGFEDHANLLSVIKDQPAAGPLALPAARDLRLILVGIGRDQKGYFASGDARRGAAVTLDFRASAGAEAELLGEPETFPSLRSFFFQPPPPDNTVPPPAERLAAEIGLDHSALTLSGRSGHRTVLACSDQLRQTLSPESSAITFSSAADLLKRWINVLHFQILRDWTWNGLDPAGITITRIVHLADGSDLTETAGIVRLPPVIGREALKGVDADPRNPVRQMTELFFFDAFDPKPKALKLPGEIDIEYRLQPVFSGLPPVDPISRPILLPITTPPSQTPQVLSAGIALSSFTAADDYSSTDRRERKLWLQFTELPAAGDAYFVRVLARGVDPMVAVPIEPAPSPRQQGTVLPETPEAPLAIDPEWMRTITPGQPPDASGLSAMQELTVSEQTSGTYLVPLPPDLQEFSPELFGTFVYEVRLGHDASRWSTAQGRFGPALRMAGVQHPPPPLVCQAARNAAGVAVQAPFANTVLNGVELRAFNARTDLWALLYARVRQADGAAYRNVLLARTQLDDPGFKQGPLDHNQVNFTETRGLPPRLGEGLFDAGVVTSGLLRLGLSPDTALTVLAAEMFADPAEIDPLGGRLGNARILRISPLIPVPDAC